MEEPTLAELVRTLRGDLTQVEFAKLVGVGDSMIAQVETGRRSLSVESLETITEALGLNSEEARRLRRARDVRSGLSQRGDADAPDPTELLARQMQRMNDLLEEMAGTLPAIEARLSALEDRAG